MSVKTKLLAHLEANKGAFISGGALAASLGCTRNAIWKAATALRQEGYPIEAAPNRGYCLHADSDILSQQALQPYLSSPDVSITILSETPSTNQTLKQLALAEPLPQGSLVLADTQTAGRGRRDHTFYSPAGTGLYLSILLRPHQTLENSLTLTAAAAVAVCRAVRRLYRLEPEIKWVNDLFLHGKKVGGILTEAVTDFETGHMDFVVIGIGLNLFPPRGGFPDEIASLAGSLQDFKEEPLAHGRCRLAAEIVNEMLRCLTDDSVMAEYARLNLLPGHRVRILQGDTQREALALAITPEGRLLVENEDGSREALLYGEVTALQAR